MLGLSSLAKRDMASAATDGLASTRYFFEKKKYKRDFIFGRSVHTEENAEVLIRFEVQEKGQNEESQTERASCSSVCTVPLDTALETSQTLAPNPQGPTLQAVSQGLLPRPTVQQFNPEPRYQCQKCMKRITEEIENQNKTRWRRT